MKVRTQTNLVSVRYLRKKVPLDLRKHYGRESIRQSLGQRATLADAKQEACRRATQYDAEFDRLREARLLVTARPLKADMVPLLSMALQGHILAADAEGRTSGMSEEAFGQLEEAAVAEAAEVRRAYARGDSSQIDAALCN